VPVLVSWAADEVGRGHTERYHALYAFIDLLRACSIDVDDVVSFARRDGIVVILLEGDRVSYVYV
jgi:hypothetical protein